MSMIGMFVQLTNEQFSRVLSDPSQLESMIKSAEESATLSIDKNWEAIYFILTGGSIAENPDHPLGRIIFSHQFFDEEQELGYGPAHYLAPDHVQTLDAELQQVTDEEVTRRYDGAKMDEAGIYPEGWQEDGARESLAESFGALRNFYRNAAQRGHAVVSFIS